MGSSFRARHRARSCGVVLARSFFAAARRIAVETITISLAERSPHPVRIVRCCASTDANDPPPPGEGQVKYNLKVTASDCTRRYRVLVEPRLSRLRGGPRMPGRYRWRFPSVTLTLVSRSCVARQEPYIPGALSIL